MINTPLTLFKITIPDPAGPRGLGLHFFKAVIRVEGDTGWGSELFRGDENAESERNFSVSIQWKHQISCWNHACTTVGRSRRIVALAVEINRLKLVQ
jgi:hypothetical protein